MFVRSSKYLALLKEYNSLVTDRNNTVKLYNNLHHKYNDLVRRINDKGGEPFLEQELETRFSKDDITELLLLCHPDKHDNSELSAKVTRKLIKLRRVK